MDFQTALILLQDGLTTGAIYILLAMAMILVFGTTRILYIPQGEIVSYGALTLAALQAGKLPGTVWLLLLLGLAAAVADTVRLVSLGDWRSLPLALAETLVPAIGISLLVRFCAGRQLSMGVQVLLTLLIITPMGPYVYKVAFQPIAEASVLVLLVASMAVHFVMEGAGLLFFGPEGFQTLPFSAAQIALGPVTVSGQSLCVFAICGMLIALLAWFFGKTLYGKALRAVAFNRKGALLIGVSPNFSGALALALASGIGALSGILIGSLTTIYYDSGFEIGLKATLGAIVGGFVSYPVAAIGSLGVGLLESYSSFWASAYKDAIVFALVIPILLWRSMSTVHYEAGE